MYPIDRTRLALLRREHALRLDPNVYFLGTTSLLTDVSAEMAAAVLPVYLMFTLGLSPLQFGVVDGLYQGAAAALALAGGLLADRRRRYRAVAAWGYGLSAICKLGLLIAGSAWGSIAAVILIDRAGKGLRTAPRDALLSLSAPPRDLGLAFGMHRAFDTAGSLLGPLVAFAVLLLMPGAFDVVFVSSFFIAVTGLAVLLLLVDEARVIAPHIEAPVDLVKRSAHLRWRDLWRELGANSAFKHLNLIGFALAAATVPDAFFYLTIQQSTGLTTALFPLLPVAMAGSFLLLAIPAGWVADHCGRTKVFVCGQFASLAGGLCLLAPAAGNWLSLAALVMLGLYYACTDGVIVAAVSARLPVNQRAAGIGVLVVAIGAGRLLASLLFGGLWGQVGLHWAVGMFCAAQAMALAIILLSGVRMEHLHVRGAEV